MHAQSLASALGKMAAEKYAAGFILPPRKVTPRGKAVRPTGKIDFDGEGGPSQSPHRYGIPRKKPSQAGADDE